MQLPCDHLEFVFFSSLHSSFSQVKEFKEFGSCVVLIWQDDQLMEEEQGSVDRTCYLISTR